MNHWICLKKKKKRKEILSLQMLFIFLAFSVLIGIMMRIKLVTYHYSAIIFQELQYLLQVAALSLFLRLLESFQDSINSRNLRGAGTVTYALCRMKHFAPSV